MKYYPERFANCDKCHIGDDSFINDERIDNILQQAMIGGWIVGEFRERDKCPFCSNRLANVTVANLASGRQRRFSEISSSTMWHCRHCAYWQWYVGDYGEDTAYLANMRGFDESLPDGLPNEFAQAIRRKPTLWNSMKPRSLEIFVADILKANYEPCEVVHIGQPDDGGVDVLFVDSSSKQWLVQVKRRESLNASEGVSTVRNLLGAMVVAGSLRGILVSTADHFTYRANEAAGRASLCGMTVRLVDRGKLDRMIAPLIPDQPWRDIVVAEMDEHLANSFADGLSAQGSDDLSPSN